MFFPPHLPLAESATRNKSDHSENNSSLLLEKDSYRLVISRHSRLRNAWSMTVDRNLCCLSKNPSGYRSTLAGNETLGIIGDSWVSWVSLASRQLLPALSRSLARSVGYPNSASTEEIP